MRALALFFVVVLATGCNAIKEADDMNAAADEQFDRAKQAAPRDLHPGAARVTAEPILTTRVIKRGQAMTSLPADLATRRVTVNLDRPVTLTEICSQIIDFAHIGCRVEDQVPDFAGAGVGGGVGPGAVAVDAVVTAANVATTYQSTMLGSAGMIGRQAQFTPSFTGELGEFVTYLQNAYDTGATIRNGAIVFQAFTLRKYYVPAAPTQQSITSQVSGATTGQGAGAVGSTAAHTSTTTSTADPWREVETTMQKLVPTPNRFALNPSIRHVFVIARPSVLRATDQYFESLVGFLQTRIVVEASMIEVSATETDSYGMNLAPMFQHGDVVANFIGAAPALTGSVGSGSVALLAPLQGGSSHFAGSSIAVKAIASDSRLSRVTHANNLVQNGRPTEMVLTTSQDYLKNLGLSTVAQAGVASQQTQTETVDYGDTIQMTASMVGNDQIQVRFSLNSTSLANLVDKQVGADSSVQLKTLPRRLFELDVPVESGETLVVAGQEQYVARRNRTGQIKPGFCLLGCDNNGDVERIRLILLLTATRVPSRHEMRQQ
jgi:hypothetical protein